MFRTVAAVSLALSSILAAQAQEPAVKTTNSVIREHMEVVGSDKVHVGTVDKYEGKEIKLTRSDPAAKGQHHTIPSHWVGTLSGNTIVLNKTAKDVMAEWTVADRPAGDAKR
ncbi:DUF2171 domain-containing protein [Methylobacterium iners]|uniref:DUF2171 domain-containing protein n=1 Tax=Methylobacterium iners TaxID=418707 RepID=A0ABQ4S4K7_9HYPH|nr:DUF2171 domain-containing protein [Methylobacterium iners]GJD97357.1 hypothetical protein OCOJLMKI_4586 [Methylobacterium iners]